MRWSCETAALREGPLGKPPFATDSRNVVRCDGGRAPTPASPGTASPAAPVSVPTLKPDDVFLSSSPPQAERAIASAARATPKQERVTGMRVLSVSGVLREGFYPA